MDYVLQHRETDEFLSEEDGGNVEMVNSIFEAKLYGFMKVQLVAAKHPEFEVKSLLQIAKEYQDEH